MSFCCCCRQWYFNAGLGLVSFRYSNVATWPTQFTSAPIPGGLSGPSFDVDYRNKVLYKMFTIGGVAKFQKRGYKDTTSNWTPIVNLADTLTGVFSLSIDYRHQKAYYVTITTGVRTLKSISYDGVTITSITTIGNTPNSFFFLRYEPSSDLIAFNDINGSNSKEQLRTVTRDGTVNTLLKELTSTSNHILALSTIAITSQVVWHEQTATQSEIHTMKMNGANEQTILTFTRVNNSNQDIFVSNQDRKIYYSRYASSANAGQLRRCNFDGSGDEVVLPSLGKFSPGSTEAYIRLGCGLEKMGSSTKA